LFSSGFVDSAATSFLGETAALFLSVLVSLISEAVVRGRGAALGRVASARGGAGTGLDRVKVDLFANIDEVPDLDPASVEVLRDKVEVLRDIVDTLRGKVEVFLDNVEAFAAFEPQL